ncbi:MAG: LamG domain-containing protein [Sporichthyaceae bacterium]
MPFGAESGPRDLGTVALLTESEAMDQAKASGQPVVASSLTTSTTIVTALPQEGVYRAEISPIPVRVPDSTTGLWHPVDNTLVRGEDGSVRPARPAVPMSFSSGGDAPLASIADPDGSMALSWPAPLPEPTLVGTAAVYESVLPEVDLVARAGTLGFSTYLVVHTPEAALHPMVREFAFDVDANGVQLAEGAGGHLVATDASGETVFRASQPLMWAAGETPAAFDRDGSDLLAEEQTVGAPLAPPAEVEPIRMAVEASADRIELTPPASALADDGAAWPRVLDPGFTATTGNDDIPAWTMLWSNGMEFYNDPSEDARVGRDEWSSSWKTSRSYFKIDISSLGGDKVHRAVFTHKQIHSPNSSCTATTFGPAVQVGLTSSALSSSTTWSNKPGWWDSTRVASNTAVNGHESTCGGSTNQEWNITGSIQEKTGDNVGSVWIAMRSAEEGDRNGWRRYDNNSSYPKLSVDYSIYPDAPSGLGIGDSAKNQGVDGWWTSDDTPTLGATVHSPNGGGAKVRFEVYEGSTLKYQSDSTTEPNGTPVYRTVTAGLLQDGHVYTVKAWSVANPDPNYSTSGALTSKTYVSRTFHVDTTAPAAPRVTLANKGKPCRVAAQCRFLFEYVAPDAEKIDYFKYGFNVDAPTSNTSAAGADRLDYEYVIPTVFGPSWLSAASVDLAGNVSVTPSLLSGFRIDGAVMAHRWNLDTFTDRTDGTKASPDSIAAGGIELTVPVEPSGNGPAGVNDIDQAITDGGDMTLALNGSSQYAFTTGGTPPLDSSKDFTVAAWVRNDDTTGADKIFLSQNSGSSLHKWYVGFVGGKWTFKGYPGDGTVLVATVDPPAGGIVGKWVHVTASYDQQTGKGADQHRMVLRVSIDGHTTTGIGYSPEDTVAPIERSTGLPAATGPVLIGRSTTSSGSANWFWKGAIDDVRVFPGVLDASQLRRILAERRGV